MSLKLLELQLIKNKQVVLRCDLNVPLKNGIIGDDGRIIASLSTIKKLLDQKCSIVIIAHLGRPKGERNAELSLEPIAKRLGELLMQDIKFSKDILGVKKLARSLKPGEILMIENIRFQTRETSKYDAERMLLAQELATYGEVYVGDGFGAVHRKHASVFELATLLPSTAGDLITAEIDVLKQLTKDPDRPYGVVLGGAKVSDKIGVILNLLDKVNLIAIGGGMVFTFLAAKGSQVGKSLVETDLIPTVQDILRRAEKLGVEILLPIDIVVSKEFLETSTPTIVASDQIPNNQMGLDIGPNSAAIFADAIRKCKTVFWNGPMGVFEFPNYANGTKIVAQALTEVNGLSVIGGGDSAAAVRKLGFKDRQFGYISTGGGASLEYLEGKELPGLMVLS